MLANRESFTVHSKTEPDKEYIVYFDPLKGLSCECMGWTMKQKCWHCEYISRKYNLERQ